MSKHGQRTVRKKLADHTEDWRRRPEERPASRPQADLSYTLGVRQDSLPFDEPLKTNAEKFASSQQANQKKQRMAGDVLGALNYDVKQGTGLPSAFKRFDVGISGVLSSALPTSKRLKAELRTPEIPQ